MPFEPLKPEDLPLVNRLLQTQPEILETITVIKHVTAKAKFPIHSFDDLAEALGGDQATVTFHGRTLSLAEVRNLVPAYYFPIASERDLLAKVLDLSKRFPAATMSPPPRLAASLMIPAGSHSPVGKKIPESILEQVRLEQIRRSSGPDKDMPGYVKSSKRK
jgi:hypothetical protein